VSGLLLFYAGAIQDVLGLILLGAIVVLQIMRIRKEKGN
jgi:hypothetical protein